MLMDYIRTTMHKAHYRVLPEHDQVYGEIPGYEGVNAKADNIEDCRHALAEALEEWVFVRASRNLPLPVVEGVHSPISRNGL